MGQPAPNTSAHSHLLKGLFARRAVNKAATPPAEPLPGLPPDLPSGHDTALHAASPGQGIAYDPLLVRQLVQEHRALVQQFSALTPALEAGRFAELPALLTAFKAGFDRHLLAENVRFYCYLEEQARQRDPGRREAIRAFRREMNEIARHVTSFARTWLATPPDAARSAMFADHMGRVGGLLLQRIRREEQTLYPLYAPPA